MFEDVIVWTSIVGVLSVVVMGVLLAGWGATGEQSLGRHTKVLAAFLVPYLLCLLIWFFIDQSYSGDNDVVPFGLELALLVLSLGSALTSSTAVSRKLSCDQTA